jgi:multidrug efflux pump subunit AcrA (membrane-fusion protein)
VVVTTLYAGRVEELTVAEGDEVHKGDVLIRLDTALLDTDIGQAEGALAVAKAQLAKAEAGATPAQLAQAEALLKQAIAGRDGAKKALDNARLVQKNPQELNLKIADVETQWKVTQHRVTEMKAALGAAEALRDRARELAYWPGSDTAKTMYETAKSACTQAQAAYDAAVRGEQAAKKALDQLRAIKANPLMITSQVEGVEAQLRQAEAAVETAEAGVAMARAGATPEQLNLARANVRQKQADLEALQVQRERMTILAPADGLVVQRAIRLGEMASAGGTLLTLANLSEVRLTIYVPEDEVGKVRVGQRAVVKVDSFPGREFEGRVATIASQAEFTPKSVQTEKSRVHTVFAVRITVPNPDHTLKPGMPADARVELGP